MSKPFLLLFGLLMLAATPTGTCLAAETNPPSAAADYSAARLLASAQNSLAALEQAEDELSRDIGFRGAVVSLTGLYQLHGFSWALPKLREIVRHPDCPEMYYGVTADGRLRVTVDRLDLRNPVFEGYALYLCTFESHTDKVLRHGGTGQRTLEFRLPDGTAIRAEELASGHPLWDQLSSMIPTFYPPDLMNPGSGFGFKQAFVLPDGQSMEADSLVVTWGPYEMHLPIFQRSDDE